MCVKAVLEKLPLQVDNQTDLGFPVLLGAIGSTAVQKPVPPVSVSEAVPGSGESESAAAVAAEVSPVLFASGAAAAAAAAAVLSEEEEDHRGTAGLVVRVQQSAPSPGGVDTFELIEVNCRFLQIINLSKSTILAARCDGFMAKLRLGDQSERSNS